MLVRKKLPPIQEEEHHRAKVNQKSMPSKGIGSCSGVDESIVRAFFESGDDDRHRFKGCGTPLGMLSSFITCWKPSSAMVSSASSSASSSSCSSSPMALTTSKSKKAWKTAALLELSKQQQAALADKQDAIDMLEWQLEQLQVAASSIGSAAHEDEMAALDRCIQFAGDDEQQQEDHDPKDSSNAAAAQTPPPPQALLECSEAAALVILLEMAVVRARLSIRQFCSLFLRQMEASGYPVVRLLAEMEPGSTFARKEHVAYVIDSRVNRALFHCFESESYDEEGATGVMEPSRRCAARLHEYRRLKCSEASEAVDSRSSAFSPAFLAFCRAKTGLMWDQFGFGVSFRSATERDAFTSAFLDVAKSAWLLHRLAFAMNPNAAIVRVARGTPIATASSHAEPVVALDEHRPRSCSKCGNFGGVEFMVMPGFRTPKKVIKCQVYPHLQCK